MADKVDASTTHWKQNMEVSKMIDEQQIIKAILRVATEWTGTYGAIASLVLSDLADELNVKVSCAEIYAAIEAERNKE